MYSDNIYTDPQKFDFGYRGCEHTVANKAPSPRLSEHFQPLIKFKFIFYSKDRSIYWKILLFELLDGSNNILVLEWLAQWKSFAKNSTQIISEKDDIRSNKELFPKLNLQSLYIILQRKHSKTVKGFKFKKSLKPLWGVPSKVQAFLTNCGLKATFLKKNIIKTLPWFHTWKN